MPPPGHDMKIIEDIIGGIGNDAPVKDVRTCTFWTAVVSRRCGLASTLRLDCHGGNVFQVKSAGGLDYKSALNLARMALSDLPLEASIGMAAVNSLIDIDIEKCVEMNAREVIIEKGKGKNIGIIGHFPFIGKLREHAKNLWIYELRPAPGDLPREEYARYLPQCDVVAISGTTLINHTLDEVLSHCRPDAFRIMLGPTTPLAPVLLDYGFDVLCGSLVTDAEAALRCIGQGANFRQIKGVQTLSLTK